MPITLRVGSPERSLGAFRFSYPVRLCLDDGSEVLLHKYYTDFVRLHEALLSSAPAGATLPTLPEKRWDGRERVRERRRAMFQYFLDWCLIHAKDNAKLLDFLNVRSLTVAPPVATSVDTVADVPDSVYQGKAALGPEQNLLKFAFFAFFWLLTWRAMLVAPSPSKTIAVPVVHDMNTSISHVSSLINTTTTIVEAASNVVLVEVIPERVNEKITIEVAVPEKTETVAIAVEMPTEDGSEIVEEIMVLNAKAASEEFIPATSTVEVVVAKEAEADDELLQNVDKTIQIADSDVVVPSIAEPSEALEKRPRVEFFFTPVHGLLAFLGLYIAVLAWSAYYPPKTERIVPVEIAFHGQEAASATTSPAVVPSSAQSSAPVSAIQLPPAQGTQHQQQQSTTRAMMTFEEAKELFAKMPARTPREEQEASRAMAFFMRATGQDASSSSSSIRVLTQFWEEASAVSPQEAQRRFIGLVSARVFANGEVSQANDSVMPEDSTMIATTPVKISTSNTRVRSGEAGGMRKEEDSNITSFDSTDISSLSVSPSPIREVQTMSASSSSNQTGGLTVEKVGKPTILRFTEHDKEDTAVDEMSSLGQKAVEVTIGAVIGVVGAAVATSLLRRGRARLF